MLPLLKDHLISLLTLAALGPLFLRYALPLLAAHLSEIRKRQIARAVSVAFFAVENLKAELADEKKDMPAVAKTAEFVKQLDSYMASNGWRPLTDAEKAVALQEANAMHGASKTDVPEASSASPLASAPAA